MSFRYNVQRALDYWPRGWIWPDWRDKIKDTARWNIEKGLALSADELTQSELANRDLSACVPIF